MTCCLTIISLMERSDKAIITINVVYVSLRALGSAVFPLPWHQMSGPKNAQKWLFSPKSQETQKCRVSPDLKTFPSWSQKILANWKLANKVREALIKFFDFKILLSKKSLCHKANIIHTKLRTAWGIVQLLLLIFLYNRGLFYLFPRTLHINSHSGNCQK